MLLDLPANLVNKQRALDRVIAVNQRVKFRIWHIKDCLKQVKQVIHLSHIKKRERLPNIEHLYLKIPLAVPNRVVKRRDHCLIKPNIIVIRQMKSYLHRITFDRNQEQLLNTLCCVRNLLDELGKLLQVVNLAVHNEDLVDVLGTF